MGAQLRCRPLRAQADVLAFTDAGMQVTELSFDAVLQHLHWQDNALWIAGPAGDVLRHDLP
jgi:hypothetical protein